MAHRVDITVYLHPCCYVIRVITEKCIANVLLVTSRGYSTAFWLLKQQLQQQSCSRILVTMYNNYCNLTDACTFVL